MIRVVCGCGRVFKAEERHGGKRTRCPACGADLIIGQTPGSGSDDPDVDEVPSWWYPADPSALSEAERSTVQEHEDPEKVPTAVLEPTFVTDPRESARLQEDGRPVPSVAAAGGWSLWTLAGAVTVSAALILGATWWMQNLGPGPGDAVAGRAHRAGARPPGAGRGPGVREAAGRGAPSSSSDGSPDGRVHGNGASGAVDHAGRSDHRSDDGLPAAQGRRLRLIVPAYIYPNVEGRRQWRRLIDAAGKIDVIAVVNPDSGPGAERNPDYAAVIADAAGQGVKLAGYISTRYAERPATEVKGEIDAWLRFYPRIAGFFLDQQPVDARHATYIADISTYARSKLHDAIIITNPGIPCDESYLTRRASDLVCVFASFEGFSQFELPANLREHDPSHYAALVYQVADPESMQAMLKEAVIKRIGHIFITDGKKPNPWDRLPPYWEAEVDAVARLQ